MITLELALAVAAAAIVATVIRLYDTPKDTLIDDGVIHWEFILPVLAGAAIATPVGVWLLGLEVMTLTGFAEAVAIGIAGLSFVKAALNIKE